jgi:acyl carrier protein
MSTTEATEASRAEIFDSICKLLSPFNYSGIELSPDTDISADLNIDSVTVMDFVMEVEDHFDIEIPLNVLSETRTMGDLVKVVEAGIGRSRLT